MNVSYAVKKPEQLNNHLSVVRWKVQYFSRFWMEENASALIVFMYTIILWKWMVNGASALAFGRIYYTYIGLLSFPSIKGLQALASALYPGKCI